MPPEITCASALPGKTGNMKIAFVTHCIGALPEFSQSLLDCFNLFDSWPTLMLYDSLNLVINAFSLGLFWWAWFRRKEVENAAALGFCCTHKAPVLCACTQSSGFPLSQGNAEAPDRWGGKAKHLLISYFLSNISAKNYRNRSCMSRL